jgi:hypothetical protein
MPELGGRARPITPGPFPCRGRQRGFDTTANRTAALKVIEEIRASGIVSARGIARELTARGVLTTTGSSTWAAAQVQRILRTA